MAAAGAHPPRPSGRAGRAPPLPWPQGPGGPALLRPPRACFPPASPPLPAQPRLLQAWGPAPPRSHPRLHLPQPRQQRPRRQVRRCRHRLRAAERRRLRHRLQSALGERVQREAEPLVRRPPPLQRRVRRSHFQSQPLPSHPPQPLRPPPLPHHHHLHHRAPPARQRPKTANPDGDVEV